MSPRASTTGPSRSANGGGGGQTLASCAPVPQLPHPPAVPRPSAVVPVPCTQLRWLCSSPSTPAAGRLTPQSLEDLEDQKRKKKKEKMGFGSISRVFARGKQRKSLDPGLFDGTAPDYYIEEDADW